MVSNREQALRTAVVEYLFPFLEISNTVAKDSTTLIADFRLHSAVKYQLLEEPGPADGGRFMLVLQGLVDSYYHCPFTGKLWGRHVYYRHDVVFAAESFYRNERRGDYIRALEPSTLLSLPYSTLRALAERYPPVQAKLRLLAASHNDYLLEYNLRNTLPAEARVRAFLEQHPTLPHRTTAEICAMHNHMSRYWYSKTLKGIS